MTYTQPANHHSRRSFLKAVGGLGSLALAPWPRALGAESQVKDLLVLIPGITGSVLQKNNKDVWAVTRESVGGALASLGRNLDTLALKDDPQDVEDLGDGVVATALFLDVHLIPGFSKIDGYSGVKAALSQRLNLDGAKNYIEFPYDWRRDNRVAARRLARLVPAWLDQWKKASGNADAKVVFIAHSMGGLVVKKAYLLGKQDAQFSSIISKVHGIMFLATPHRGAQHATTLNNILSSTPLGPPPKGYVHDLQLQSYALQDINEQFRHYCQGLLLVSFFETYKTNFGVTKSIVSRGILV